MIILEHGAGRFGGHPERRRRVGHLDTMLGLHLAEGCDEADEVPVFVNSLLNVCCQSHVWFRLEVIPGG